MFLNSKYNDQDKNWKDRIKPKLIEASNNYLLYIKDMKNIYVNKALIRVFNNIEIDKINDFIDNIKIISEMRKEFYKKLINIRYNILKEVYNKLVFFKERID